MHTRSTNEKISTGIDWRFHSRAGLGHEARHGVLERPLDCCSLCRILTQLLAVAIELLDVVSRFRLALPRTLRNKKNQTNADEASSQPLLLHTKQMLLAPSQFSSICNALQKKETSSPHSPSLAHL